MSRRRKSAANGLSSKDKKSEADASKTEWSEEEKIRLLDALQIDEGSENWRWIARQVKTKTIAQVKEYASKLETEKPALKKRAIAPKDDSPLEEWINVTKRLRGDNDVDGTCIPQKQASRKKDRTDSPQKAADVGNKQMDQDHSDDDDKEEQQDPAADGTDHKHNDGKNKEEHQHPDTDKTDNKQSEMSSKSHSNDLQKISTVIENVLTNQKQMMENISVLESKLAKLHSDDLSSQSTVMEFLNKINDRLDQLGKNTSRSCCGGPVIIQTTPHANVVHQPILDSCSSCRDAKTEKRTVNSASVSSEHSTCLTTQNRDNHVCATSLNETSVRTSSSTENAAGRNVSGNGPAVILIPDSHNEPSPRQRTETNGMPSVTSSLHSVPSVDRSPVVGNNQGSSLTSVSSEPERKVNKSDSSEQRLPGIRGPFPNGDGYSVVVRQVSSLPNRSMASINANQSAIATTASATSLSTVVSSVPTKPREPSYQIEHRKTFTSTSPPRQYPAPIQIISTPSRQSQHNEHQTGLITNSGDKNEPTHKPGQDRVSEFEPHHLRPASVCPASISPGVRSPVAHYYPVGVSAGPSHYLPQQAILVVSSSGASTSSSVLHSPQSPQVAPTSVPKNAPPGYITLSHAPNVTTPVNKSHITPAWQPQTVMTTTASHSTQQGKVVDASPAAGAVMQRSDDANSQQSKVLPKDLLNAAILISNYVSEHPNQENQTQWKACFNTIVADFQKSKQEPAKGDLLQSVSIGRNPHVLLTQQELADALEKSRSRPKFYAMRLAEKLFGMDVLIKSTPYGIGGKDALNPVILDAIKVDVLEKFAHSMSSEEQKNLWKGCVTSIAQRCKRARNPQRRRSRKSKRNDEGPPSMAVGSEMHYDEHDDSQVDSDEEEDEYDMDNLDRSSSSHTPTPTIVRISSDSEQEEPQNGTRDGEDHGENRHIKEVQDSNGPPESTADSREESEDGEQGIHVPPGIDPDITVVHLPSTMQAAVNVSSKQEDRKSSPVLVQSSSVEASGSTSDRSEGAEDVGAYTVRMDHEAYGHESEGSPQERNMEVARKFYGEFPPVVGSIYKPGPESTESIIVSGIKMTPDFSHVLIGGNPNVVLPRQNYLDCLTRSGQPTHFAVRLAELTFGDEVLKASTVTGGKKGTLQLDPNVIDAIQTEVTERFLKDASKEQQTAVLRKCVTSIATRCKTLRYNRSKPGHENHWTFHTSHMGDVK